MARSHLQRNDIENDIEKEVEKEIICIDDDGVDENVSVTVVIGYVMFVI